MSDSLEDFDAATVRISIARDVLLHVTNYVEEADDAVTLQSGSALLQTIYSAYYHLVDAMELLARIPGSQLSTPIPPQGMSSLDERSPDESLQ